MSEFLSAGYDDHLAKGLQLPFTTFIYLLYFIFTFFFLARAKGGNRGSISRLHVEVSNIWVLFVFYFSAFGITCNVAEMKEKVRDLKRFYRHINQKETFL